jgi:hypothetical protein
MWSVCGLHNQDSYHFILSGYWAVVLLITRCEVTIAIMHAWCESMSHTEVQ